MKRPSPKPDDSRPIIHLLSVAGSCRKLIPALGFKSALDLIKGVQKSVGPRYRVTGNARLINAKEDENHGGRSDDRERALDLQRNLADDRVCSLISLRGGSWLTRILPRIDFSVLGRRRNCLAIFGFSELTTLINISARYPSVIAYYDLGPAFLRAGLADYARKNIRLFAPDLQDTPEQAETFALNWASDHFRAEFSSFFVDVVNRLEGRGSARKLTGKLHSGKLPVKTEVSFVGGTLSVLTPLIGTQFQSALEPNGSWLVLEDINEAPHRIDRALAHLSLAGLLSQYQGFLIGDFHDDSGDQTPAALACLMKHLSPRSKVPVVVSRDVGHVWPMAPLPIGRKLQLIQSKSARSGFDVRLETPWPELAVRAAFIHEEDATDVGQTLV